MSTSVLDNDGVSVYSLWMIHFLVSSGPISSRAIEGDSFDGDLYPRPPSTSISPSIVQTKGANHMPVVASVGAGTRVPVVGTATGVPPVLLV